jgi:hypothetical protein
MAHLDTSTTGHTLDTEFDLLGLVVERTTTLRQGDALGQVLRKRRLDSIEDSGEGGLKNKGNRHYSVLCVSSTSGWEADRW